MKLGQMASILDFNGLPPGEVEELQTKLGELRDRAPQVSFKEMRKVIEQDLGERIENLFAEFEPDAAASASIGQVYRARLGDGRGSRCNTPAWPAPCAPICRTSG